MYLRQFYIDPRVSISDQYKTFVLISNHTNNYTECYEPSALMNGTSVGHQLGQLAQKYVNFLPAKTFMSVDIGQHKRLTLQLQGIQNLLN